MVKKISYTFWGDSIDSNWYEWHMAVANLFDKLGYKITHYGISSGSYHPNKVVTAARRRKVLLDILKSGEVPDAIECYALPKDFNAAACDYYIFCSRDSTHQLITFVMREEVALGIDDKDILEMKKYIRFSEGEVYSTYGEVPMNYAYSRDKKRLNSYELIKKIN